MRVTGNFAYLKNLRLKTHQGNAAFIVVFSYYILGGSLEVARIYRFKARPGVNLLSKSFSLPPSLEITPAQVIYSTSSPISNSFL